MKVSSDNLPTADNQQETMLEKREERSYADRLASLEFAARNQEIKYGPISGRRPFSSFELGMHACRRVQEWCKQNLR